MEGKQENHLLKALEQSQDAPTQAELRMIERCNQIALGSLSGALKAMLEKAMDDFIALADKPGERPMQDLYLQALTLIREKSTNIEEGFRNHLFDAFQAAVHPRKTPAPLKASDDEFDFDQFSLVDPDDLEESIATREMVAKIEGSCKDELVGLEKRMALLLHDAEFKRHKNPFAPTLVVEAYMAACRDTEAPIKVRLLFVAMWDKHMQNAVLSTYHEINQYLIEKDILPKIKREIRRAGGGTSMADIAAIAAQAAVEAMQAVENEGDVYGAMQQMLSAAAAQGGLPGVTLPSGSSVAHNPAILAQLSRLQHEALAAQMTQAGLSAAGMAPVTMLRELKDSDIGDKMGHADAMTIEIVAMLFDYIFDDKKVPDGIKALLGRLQIPVLKAAMLDQAFFSKRNHPTRRLLNMLGEAAAGWDMALDHTSPLYQKVESLVQRILDTFEDNLAVFEETISDFEQFMAEQEKVTDALIEAATPLIVEKEAQAIALEEAREAAEDAVRPRANDADIPEAVRTFLCQSWTGALSSAYLAGGAEGATWLEAVSTMDDLLWSVRPKATKEGREQLIKVLPSLLRRLKTGMERAQTEQTLREQFLSQLVKCHAAAVSAGFHGQDNAASSTAPALGTAVVLQFPKSRAAADQEVKLEILTPSPTHEGLDVEEITIGSVGWEEDEGAEPSAAEDAEAATDRLEIDEETARDVVGMLKPGMLVEFRHHGMEPMQAKLKWISPLKGTFLFADRQGKRAATMPRDKLEAAFRIGSAKLLDEAPLLDRAVDNVIETLKKAAA